MIRRLVQQQKIRFFQKQADERDFRPLAARELRQPFLLILSAKPEPGKNAIVLHLVLVPLPGKQIPRRTGREKLLFHGPLPTERPLLAEHPDSHISGHKDPGALALIV